MSNTPQQQPQQQQTIWDKRTDRNRTSEYWLKHMPKGLRKYDPTKKRHHANHDLVELSRYQTAVSTFVHSLTSNSGIPVRYMTLGNENCTDGKTVFLSLKHIEEGQFDVAVGIALHEASHILYTHFPTWKRAIQEKPTEKQVLFKTLLNVVEDLYIDARTFKEAPGYRGYYAAVYQEYNDSPKIQEIYTRPEFATETTQNYIAHILNFCNPKRNLDILPKLRALYVMVDHKNILRLTTFNDRVELAERMFKMLDVPEVENNMPSEPEVFKVDLSGMSEGDRKKLEKILEQLRGQYQRTMGQPGEDAVMLSAAEVETIMALSEADIKVQDISSKEHDIPDVKTYIVRNVTKSLISSEAGRGFGLHVQRVNRGIHNAISRGKRLANQIRLRNEERTLTTNRLDKGKLDTRLLHELGYQGENVFKRITIQTYSPLYMHLSIDQSGSMSGGNWSAAIELAATLATASLLLKNIHIVVTARSCTNRNGKEVPYMLYLFDSKRHGMDQVKSVFPHVAAYSSTPEGLCVHSIMDDIIKQSANTEAYFINISDGMPGCSAGDNYHYGGDLAIRHTAAQRQRMERAGIGVLGYFIGDDRSYTHFAQMYGSRNSHIIRSSQDLNIIANGINRKFLENERQ